MMSLVQKLLSCRIAVLALIALVSFGALAAALVAQFAFDLAPCILCLYQRIPFVIAGVLAMIGLVFKPARAGIVALCGLAFLGNAGLALYHFGVEELWWRSIFEACAIPDNFLTGDDTQSLLDQLTAAPNVPCTQVAWVDPIFGMSMAFYNIWLCLGMAGICALHFIFKRQLP